MYTDEISVENLSSLPSKQVDQLPVITKNVILPFDKLEWADFERFCFQLGSKSMDCLSTSFIYGRKGQKQDGIDIYFQKDGCINVWQIKRYAEFKSADVIDAVSTFLSGKWAAKANVFTLCVSNYLDDTGVVDEIDKQSRVLGDQNISFEVLNSEKLTIMTRDFPVLVETFFGLPWCKALGISEVEKTALPKRNRWQTNTGKVLDPQQIYHHGDFNVKLTDDIVYIDEQLPDGSDTHVSFDPATGVTHIEKFPYPLKEYKIAVPQKIITHVERGTTVLKGKRYTANIYHLKWGKCAIFLFDNGELVDISINTRSFIDNTNKIIHVLDITDQAVDL